MFEWLTLSRHISNSASVTLLNVTAAGNEERDHILHDETCQDYTPMTPVAEKTNNAYGVSKEILFY